MIATNIVLSAQVKRECSKPFSSKDFSCHKTFASYLALTVLHKNTAKITWESKQREKSKIVIRRASPARANNNCWLLLLEDNSEAGAEHCCALSKHVWQYASVVTLSRHLSYHHYIFSSLSLLPIAQTVSFTGQEQWFIYTSSICLHDSKTDVCGPSISQSLCRDTNAQTRKSPNFVSSVLQQLTNPGSSLSSLYIFPGSGP